MKRFNELTIPALEGKKVFPCKTISITDILNIEIEVHDYVSEIKTQHGEDRMVIKIRVDNEDAKFFTNCQQIKNTMLSVCGDDLPFVTTIRKIKNGTSVSYTFT